MGMLAVATVRAESSNDTVLLKLPVQPNGRIYFGGQEVGEAGLQVPYGASATLTVSNMAGRAFHYPGFTAVRTVAELESYAVPAPDQKSVCAGSGAVPPMLSGLVTQISRGQSRAQMKLATQSPGSSVTETVSTGVTNATGGVLSSRSVRTSTSAMISGGRIERIVWCAENGAINVFLSAPKAGITPK
jgi:hypothetical protein